jgi:hypothetical protein
VYFSRLGVLTRPPSAELVLRFCEAWTRTVKLRQIEFARAAQVLRLAQWGKAFYGSELWYAHTKFSRSDRYDYHVDVSALNTLVLTNKRIMLVQVSHPHCSPVLRAPACVALADTPPPQKKQSGWIERRRGLQSTVYASPACVRVIQAKGER